MTRAAIEQALQGHNVGTGSELTCDNCSGRLQEGRSVTVFAHQWSDESTWSVARLVCPTCGPDELETSTPGREEVLAEADLGKVSDVGRQWEWWMLVRPTVIGYAPADAAVPSVSR